MLTAFFRWIDGASGLLRSKLMSNLCMAYACPVAGLRAPSSLGWGHLPLNRISLLHGIH